MKRILSLWVIILFSVFVVGALTSCSPGKPEVWIYTSLYKTVIDEISGPLQKAYPDVKIQWFQGGSEVVSAKVNAELSAGGTKADLLLTSDPFWYLELKKKGILVPYNSPTAVGVDPAFNDTDHAFVTVRMPVMVIAYNSEKLKTGLPTSFQDLTKDGYKDQVSMGSPLESGTNFTAAAFLAKRYGWEYFSKLRKAGLISAGGNSSVMTRIETGERPIGILLLENVMAGMTKGSPVRAIYPKDGAIPIPSPIAIVKQKDQPNEVRMIYDWFFSSEAQAAIVKSGMYSPLPGVAAPVNALPWKDLSRSLMGWSPAIVEDILTQREDIKNKFSETVLR